MTFNGAAGEIYFIREVDRLTKEASDFVKIGLVREKEGRTSDQRLLEHQTGNPRQLEIVEVVQTPLVDAAESMLHSYFAPKRVRGEWFSFPGDSVQEAVGRSRDLAKELEQHLPLFLEASALTKQLSTPEVLEATDEILSWHEALLQARARVNFVESFEELVVEEAVKAAERGEDVKSVVEFQEKKGSEKFDESAFAKKYPDKHAEFTIIDSKFKGTFLLAGVRKLPLVQDFDVDLAQLGEEVTQLAEAVRSRRASLGALADKRLEIEKMGAKFELDQEVLTSRIKMACGTAAGITGVCTWKRINEQKPRFLKDKFKSEYPELYAEFVSISAPTVAKVLKNQVAAE